MIQEEYVSFESAKLLKECGFPQEFNEVTISYTADGDTINADYADWNYDVVAPTQAVAMRWLREEKGIYILANYFTSGEEIIFNATINGHPAVEPVVWHNTYEQAIEAGIKAACEYLKSK